MHLILLNFIIYNFQQALLMTATIFHCWDMNVLRSFSQLAYKHNNYIKFISLNGTAYFLQNLEYKLNAWQTPVMAIFVDLNCAQSLALLNETSRLRQYRQSKHWLIYDELGNITHFQQQFVNANLSIDADLTYALPQNNINEQFSKNRSYILYDVYNNGYHIGGKLNMTIDREILCNVQTCQVTQYLSKLHIRSKYDNRNSMKDVTFRMSAVATRCPVEKMNTEAVHKFLLSIDNVLFDPITRFGMQSTLPLIEMLHVGNLSIKYYDRWSSKLVEGGVIGDIVNEKADIHSAPFILIEGRLKYLSVLARTGVFRSVCLFRTPRNSGINVSGFLEPFSALVWLVFVIFLAGSALFLWSVFRLEHKQLSQQYGFISYLPSLFTTCLMAFGSACNQGSYLLPQSLGGRIIFFSVSITAFMVNNFYTSVIVSTLLGSAAKSDVSSVSQLAASNLDVGLENTSYTQIFLNITKLPDIQNFVQRKIKSKKNLNNVWLTIEDGIRKMRDNPGYAFVFEGFQGYLVISHYFKPHEICDLNELTFRPDKGLYLHAQRNSTYKELLRLRQVRLFETGIYLKHRLYWARENLNCYAGNVVTEVGLNYTAPLFIILFTFFFLCLFILYLEILYKQYKNPKKNLQDKCNF